MLNQIRRPNARPAFPFVRCISLHIRQVLALLALPTDTILPTIPYNSSPSSQQFRGKKHSLLFSWALGWAAVHRVYAKFSESGAGLLRSRNVIRRNEQHHLRPPVGLCGALTFPVDWGKRLKEIFETHQVILFVVSPIHAGVIARCSDGGVPEEVGELEVDARAVSEDPLQQWLCSKPLTSCHKYCISSQNIFYCISCCFPCS